jgi:hypothetical protein
LIIFCNTNLFAQDSASSKTLYLIYGSGNFGPNHQIASASTSFQQFELLYFLNYTDSLKFSINAGLLNNHEKGFAYCEGPSEFDINSIVKYIGLNFIDQHSIIGYYVGLLFEDREKGFCDASDDGFVFKPEIGITLRFTDKLRFIGGFENDIIYNLYDSYFTLLFSLVYLLNAQFPTVKIGYYLGDSHHGFDIETTYNISTKFIFYINGIYRAPITGYGARFGIGYKF